MKNLLKFIGISALVAVIGLSMAACGEDPLGEPDGTTVVTVPDNGFGERPADPTPVTTQQNFDIPNDVSTLGITGTTARSSNDKIATVAVAGGNVTVTSVGKGVATIYVDGDAHKSDAEIEIKVAADGTITQGPIVKGGDTVFVVSGTFGGAKIAGDDRPVRLSIQFDWVSLQVNLKPGSQDWSVKFLPFDEDKPLWFQVDIPTTGDLEHQTGTWITYQFDIL